MSGFSITVSDSAISTAVKALDGVTVRALGHTKVGPTDWNGERVHVTSTRQDPATGRTVLVAWVVDEDDMAQHRVTIDPQDLAGLVIL